MNKREIDSLLSLVAKGDNQAFERLYVETKRGVYAYIFSYFNNRSDCEDVMQTVYLKIKTNISQYSAGTNGLAWILQIAKNTALNALRANANYRKNVYPADLPVEDGFENVALKDSLLSAMKRVLDGDEQKIIVLRAVWNYKHKEIAVLLDCPVGTVTSKYKRAIDKLKKELKEERI